MYCSPCRANDLFMEFLRFISSTQFSLFSFYRPLSPSVQLAYFYDVYSALYPILTLRIFCSSSYSGAIGACPCRGRREGESSRDRSHRAVEQTYQVSENENENEKEKEK